MGINSDEHQVRMAKRAAAVGWQPKVSKLAPLIGDGLNCPHTHLARALGLRHPGSANIDLPLDHYESMIWLQSKGRLCVYERLRTFYDMGCRAKELLPAAKDVLRGSCISCQSVLPNLNHPLALKVSKSVNIEDPSLIDELLEGLPLVGDTPDSSLFREKLVPAERTVAALELGAPKRRTKIMQNMLMPSDVRRPQTRAAYSKTIEEVGQGIMRGPFSLDEIKARHGLSYNVTRRFGIQQGEKEKKGEDGAILLVDQGNPETVPYVRPKPSIIRNLLVEISEILKSNYLRPVRAGRLLGKLQFVSYSLSGKCGRAGLGCLRSHSIKRKDLSP